MAQSLAFRPFLGQACLTLHTLWALVGMGDAVKACTSPLTCQEPDARVSVVPKRLPGRCISRLQAIDQTWCRSRSRLGLPEPRLARKGLLDRSVLRQGACAKDEAQPDCRSALRALSRALMKRRYDKQPHSWSTVNARSLCSQALLPQTCRKALLTASVVCW